MLPAVAASSVGNCLSLMEAQQPFMVKAGCSRLQLLMRLDSARERAVRQGAARKLLRLLQAPDADEGEMRATACWLAGWLCGWWSIGVGCAAQWQAVQGGVQAAAEDGCSSPALPSPAEEQPPRTISHPTPTLRPSDCCSPP